MVAKNSRQVRHTAADNAKTHLDDPIQVSALATDAYEPTSIRTQAGELVADSRTGLCQSRLRLGSRAPKYWQ